eukprot:Sspe_Gene.74941::Locus_46834_Transcript_1_1_Confidence_1.000_Length_2369::g.74941::m.74941
MPALFFLGLLATVAVGQEGHYEHVLESTEWEVRVVAGPSGTYLSSLRANQEGSTPGWGRTANLLLNNSHTNPSAPPNTTPVMSQRSGSTVGVDGVGVCTPCLGTAMETTRDSVVLDGIEVRCNSTVVAHERWELSVRGGRFAFRVSRVMKHEGPASIRVGFVSAPMHRRYSADPIADDRTAREVPQIWSFLDPTARINRTANSGMVYPPWGRRVGGVWVGESLWLEARSSTTQQTLYLSPAGLAVDITATNATEFVFGYPAGKNFGSSMTQRGAIGGPRLYAFATTSPSMEVVLTLRPSPEQGLAVSHLELPDSTMQRAARRFLAGFNMLAGWQFGNSPASVVVLQEAFVFPVVQSLFRASRDLLAALTVQLDTVLDTMVADDGFVWPIWDQGGVQQATPRSHLCRFDQIPNTVLAVVGHFANTGDTGWLRGHWATLERIGGFLLRHRVASCASGLPNTCGAVNWYDLINFGHLDGVMHVMRVAALRALSCAAKAVGDEVGAVRYEQAWNEAVTWYNHTFWRGSDFADWIDSEGKERHYLYSWNNLMAAVHVVRTPGQATTLMAYWDSAYRNLTARFGGRPWCTPANLRPVEAYDLACDTSKPLNRTHPPWDDHLCSASNDYPCYENGECFVIFSGMEAAARGAAGDPETAYEIFRAAMVDYEDTRFWGQHFTWGRGGGDVEGNGFKGVDVLTDSLALADGFRRGAFGIDATLPTLRVTGRPARQLEGANWTFVHMGCEVRAEVRGGRTSILPSPTCLS